jgi:hypothetical protein
MLVRTGESVPSSQPRRSAEYWLPNRAARTQGAKFVYIDYLNDEPFYVGMQNWDRVGNPDRNSFHVKIPGERSSDGWIEFSWQVAWSPSFFLVMKIVDFVFYFAGIGATSETLSQS